ncbi:hypothetical protein [Ilumatobacter nonamiensis]|uniref:hypothetical protein n=1 Tax=Ilumatobacter nonamiensis TaxID=467093 RepID=UPI0011D2609F|nr:hypothetical protein [Ilumatobacter nonamiensis]
MRNTLSTKIIAASAVGVLSLGAAACSSDDDGNDDDPIEDVGDSIEEGVDDVGDEMEEETDDG